MSSFLPRTGSSIAISQSCLCLVFHGGARHPCISTRGTGRGDCNALTCDAVVVNAMNPPPKATV